MRGGGGMSLLGGFLLVGLGGAAGGLLRAWATAAVERWAGGRLPWGTLAVNVAGSLAAGAGAALALARGPDAGGAALGLLLGVGLLGSFTTVSAFALQVHALLARRRRRAASAYAALSLGLCLAAAAAGFGAARAAGG
jgi:fluoride exporter